MSGHRRFSVARKTLMTALLATTVSGAWAAVPVWARLLHWMSGDSDRTTVPVEAMGAHMQMSRRAPAQPGDLARGAEIITAARNVLRRYPDVASAERDGYRPFHQTGQLGEEIHYTSIGYGYSESRHVDYAHPGSLLFRRTAQGLKSVGVMYSAPGNATTATLNAIAPLSLASFHRHVDFCLARGREAETSQDPRFGYEGILHTQATCKKAGGYWLPLAFGWMTHVYPDEAQVWGGEEMSMLQAEPPA